MDSLDTALLAWCATMLTVIVVAVGFIGYELWKVRRVMRKTLLGEIYLK
jgi:hypothetical protein